MMTEIDLHGNSVAPAVDVTGVDKLNRMDDHNDLEQSETFHDEDNQLDIEDLKVTRRRSSGGDDGDDPIVVRQRGIVRRAVIWMALPVLVVSLVLGIVLTAMPSPSTSTSTTDHITSSMTVNDAPSSGGATEAVSEATLTDVAMPSTTDKNNSSMTVNDAPSSGGATEAVTETISTETEKHEDEPAISLPIADDADVTSAPTDPKKESSTTANNIVSDDITLGCLTDRFDNEHNDGNNRLYPGQYICSHGGQRYRFGLTPFGDVIYEDVESQSVTKLYENPHPLSTNAGNATVDSQDSLQFYLTLQIDGTMVMHHVSKAKKNSQLWKAEPQRSKGGFLEGYADIDLTEQCIDGHDCPYLHVHQGGVMVLNWIDDTRDGDWQTQNFMKVYGF